MTDAPSKREKQKEERRRQILEAALRVFSEKGFHAANVSDVAAEAGVSQGTIYWYFESKDELLTAAIVSVFEELGQESLAGLSQFDTAADKLRALGQGMEFLAEEGENLFALFLSYWTSTGQREEAAGIWIDVLERYKDAVVAVIEEGVHNGEFRPTDAESLVWALLAAYDGLIAYGLFMPDMDLGRISRAFIEIILQGLTAGQA